MRAGAEGPYRENRPAVPGCLRLAEPFRDQPVDLPELVFAVRVGTGVIGAGFALPRDAGQRPPPGELAGAPSRLRAPWQSAARGFAALRPAVPV